MVPEKDLFNVVKSLDSNEKRYFKLLLSLQSGGKNYGDLFNAIAVQKEYDEHALIKQFKKQIKDFASTKRNLYLLVLRSLRLYHARSSPEIRLYEMMQNIEVLFRKGLFHECSRLIKKAKREALLHNNTFAQITLLNEEAKAISRLDYENVPENYFENLLTEQLSFLEDYKTISQVKNVKDRFMHTLLRSGAIQSTSGKEQLESIVDFELLERKNLPVSAEVSAFVTLSTYHINITKNYKKSEQYSHRLLNRLEEMPRLSSELQLQYVNAQIMIAIAVLKSQGYDECYLIIKN